MSREETKRNDAKQLSKWSQTLDFSMASENDRDTLRDICVAVCTIQYPYPKPAVSFAMKDSRHWMLTFRNWNGELRLAKMYELLVDHRVRLPSCNTIERVFINPHSSLLTIEGKSQRAVSKSRSNRRRRRRERYGDRRRSEDRPTKDRRHRVVKVHLKKTPNLSNVEKEHQTEIIEAIVAISMFDDVMPTMKEPTISSTKTHYKICFRGLDKQLDVAELYRRIEDRETRDNAFSNVVNAGIDSRNHSFFLRISKTTPVNVVPTRQETDVSTRRHKEYPMDSPRRRSGSRRYRRTY